MRGIFFEYGTAVHLALLTVAPLFLFAFCGSSAHAAVLVWLSLFAVLWIVMNPSQRPGEWPRDARHRIGWELAHDPFLTFGAVALIVSAVRAINGGLALDYNAASRLWYLKGPFVEMLPGSVSGEGVLPLAGVLGVLVVTLGVRHALGFRARFVYLFASAVLGALAFVFWRILSSHGVAVPHLAASPQNPFCLGSLLGVCFLFAVVALVESWSRGRPAFEIFSAITAAVLLAGMIFHAPTFQFLLFFLLGIATVLTGIAMMFFRRSSVAWLRTAVSLAIAVSPVALLVAGEVSRPPVWPLFPDGFLALREAASSVALAAWKGSTQLGVGVGAYPLAMGFFATPEEWQVLATTQTAAPDGWIHFLCERGFLGALILLVGLGLLIRDGILRYIRAGSGWALSILHLLGPLVLLAAVAVTFVDCSYVQIAAMMPVCAALGLTAAAFSDLGEVEHG